MKKQGEKTQEQINENQRYTLFIISIEYVQKHDWTLYSLRDHLTKLLAQYDTREKHFEKQIEAKDLEIQLSDAKLNMQIETAKNEAAKVFAMFAIFEWLEYFENLGWIIAKTIWRRECSRSGVTKTIEWI